MLTNDLVTLLTVPFDDYRSNVLAQLNLVEVMSPPRAGWRSSPIALSASVSKKSARRNSDVATSAKRSVTVQTGPGGRKSVPKGVRVSDAPSSSRGTAATRQSSGCRNGGVPKEKKNLKLASVAGSDEYLDGEELVLKGKNGIVFLNWSRMRKATECR